MLIAVAGIGNLRAVLCKVFPCQSRDLRDASVPWRRLKVISKSALSECCRMGAPEYDCHDVYSKYVDLVSDAKDRDVIRDAADLPYPRKIIRATMLEFMREEKDHQKRELACPT